MFELHKKDLYQEYLAEKRRRAEIKKRPEPKASGLSDFATVVTVVLSAALTVGVYDHLRTHAPKEAPNNIPNPTKLQVVPLLERNFDIKSEVQIVDTIGTPVKTRTIQKDDSANNSNDLIGGIYKGDIRTIYEANPDHIRSYNP